MIGSNDGQDVVPPPRRRLVGQPGFPRVNWERPGWGKAYQGRVKALLSQIGGPDSQVLWLELPHVHFLVPGSRHLETALRLLRELGHVV